MTAGAGRTANLTTINALTLHDHFSSRAFWNEQICGLASVGMRALRWFGRLLHDVAGRRRETGTRGDIRGAGTGPSPIDNLVDAAANVIGNVQRAVRSNR